MEEARKRLQDSTEVNKKVPEYERKIALLSQELERLNGVVEKKNNEIGKLNNKIGEIDELNMSIGGFREKISKLVNENKGYND